MKRSVLEFSHNLNKDCNETRDPKTFTETVYKAADNMAELMKSPNVEHMRLAAVFQEYGGDVKIVEISRGKEILTGSVSIYETNRDTEQARQDLHRLEEAFAIAIQDLSYDLDEDFGLELPKRTHLLDEGVNGYQETLYVRD